MFWSKLLMSLAISSLYCVEANTVSERAVNQKCKSLFQSSGGSNICEKQGYLKSKSNNFVCKGACDVTQCCKGEATCNAFFINNGKSMCTDHGYNNRRNHESKCSVKGACLIDDCCKNQKYETCYNYFETFGKNICKTDGFKNRRQSTTKCKGKECTSVECCKGQDTCQAFFAINGKKHCKENGYENRRNHSTECKKSPCKIDECCKNKTPTETTCKDYFGSTNPKAKCNAEGFKKALENDIVCADKTCLPTECCEVRPEILSVDPQCKNTKSCTPMINGSGFGQKCEVAVHKFDWSATEPLEIISKDVICTPGLVVAQISKKIADANKQVNLQVVNKQAGTWSAPVLVTLY
eukprot:Awhi_evm1s3022